MLKDVCNTVKSLSKSPKSLTSIRHIQSRNKTLISNPAIAFILDEFEDLQSSNPVNNPTQQAKKIAEPADPVSSSIQISHPWPEWTRLMEKLMKNGYFDGVGNPFRSGRLIDGKDRNQIRTACLNFARDQLDLMRYLNGRDIQIVAGSGCPGIDRKVVNSGKRLRAHLGIDEENVCSSCSLRGNCERAYAKAREDEGGQTVDVMRLILTFGHDRITGSEDNKPFLNKNLENAIRSLIKYMVKFSKNKLDNEPSKRVPSIMGSSIQQQQHRSSFSTTPQGNWTCPGCKLLNFAKNVKCVRCNRLHHGKLQRLGFNRDGVELKKGDWLCERCSFLNFAKNTRCFQCHTNPPKRQLDPGEWACDSCNYINFKRNSVCLKCDHKRPKALNNASSSVRLYK